MIEVPSTFAWETVRREGEAGRDWLTNLPGLVDELLGRWDLTIDDPSATAPLPLSSQSDVALRGPS